PLAVEHGVGIGRAGVGLVRALLAPEIRRLLAAAAGARVAAAAGVLVLLRPEALHRRPSVDQRPVDAEMLAGQQPLHPRLGEQGRRADRNRAAMLSARSRSRFFEKVEWPHT